MNELNATPPAEAPSPVQTSGVDPYEAEAIYGILARLSQKWGYPENERSAQGEPPVPERLHGKEAVTESFESVENLDETVMLAGRMTAAEPPDPPILEEKEIRRAEGRSGWEDMEKTVIISKPPAISEKKEAVPSSLSEGAEESRAWSSKQDAIWDEAAETIRIISRDLPEASELDETLILDNRSGNGSRKRGPIEPTPEPPAMESKEPSPKEETVMEIASFMKEEAAPVAESLPSGAPAASRPTEPCNGDGDDDIILETVILRPGSYE